MTEPSSELRPRPRAPKGLRPYELGDPHTERVLYITMAVATELSVLHDKVDTIARLAADKGSFSLDDLENYVPSPEVAREREEWRKDYIRRLLRIMHEAIPDEAEARRKYTAFVEEIAEPAPAPAA